MYVKIGLVKWKPTETHNKTHSSGDKPTYVKFAAKVIRTHTYNSDVCGKRFKQLDVVEVPI